MCGIAGIVSRDPDCGVREAVERMVTAIVHRGPDGSGVSVHSFATHTVVLGHSRLAIIDLSAAGRQPMRSRCGRHLISYNGEIYNFKELREELRREGAVFETHTDTEVLLEALGRWGVAALARLNGMWALAYLDLRTGEVLLARDRLGIKPLYYYVAEGRLTFASEAKAVLQSSPRRWRVDTKVAARYLEQSLLDVDDSTFFEGLRQLPAGHYAHIDPRAALSLTPKAVRFWTAPTTTRSISDREAIDETRGLLEDAVALRLRADVRCGVLLSGGVDSSAITAVLSRLAGRERVSVLSAVSEDGRFDESPFIDLTARHLGVPVTKVRLSFTAGAIWDLFRQATWHNDAPLLSFSSVAHYQLMAEAKRAGVTVILSGQGADELFCGYRKYVPFYAQALVKEGHYAAATKMLVDFVRRRTVFSQFDLSEGARYLPRFARRRQPSVLGEALRDAPCAVPLGLNGRTLRDRQLRDLTQLSVPALLHYEDRMSMAHSREIRLPFLDYRIVEAVLPMRDDLKLRAGWTKWSLRKAAEPWLPPQVVWRKDKQGFLNPQTEWLRSLLRPGVEALLTRTMAASRSRLIDQQVLRRRYDEYLGRPKGREVTFRDVFPALALETWMTAFSDYLSN